MSDRLIKVTSEDIESLVGKLAQFDATLTDAERRIFHNRILETLGGPDDVEGHAMELRWQTGDQGLFFQWVNADEGGEAVRTTIDPDRWNTMSRGATTSNYTSSQTVTENSARS